jgi:hypothetical protein
MQAENSDTKKRPRTRKVRSYPVHPLRDALGVARGIQEANSGLPFDRLMLAGQLRTTPSSSGFVMRLKSSIRYGLTLGGYNDVRISLTEAGRAAVAPKSEEERRLALVECALRPDVFRSFYEALEGKRLPEAAFARNILERDHNIDPELAQECLDIIVANGTYVGLLRDVGGSLWVSVKGVQAPEATPTPVATREAGEAPDLTTCDAKSESTAEPAPAAPLPSAPPKVFVGHFGSPQAADRVQALLSDFGIGHVVVDVGRRTGAPMSPEVSVAMRECSSAVLIATGAAGVASGEDGPVAPGSVGQVLGFMVGAASVLYGARLVVAVADSSASSASTDLADLSVRTVELEAGSEAESTLGLLRALSEASVIQVTN